MMNRTTRPDVRTCTLLVDAMSKEGRVDEARDKVENMIRGGAMPVVVIYNTLIDGYCLQSRLKKAKKVFDSMPARGCEHKGHSCNILIHGHCRK